MVICAFENFPSIPSFLATQIGYIRYGQFNEPYASMKLKGDHR
jgi:hypothetical protein